MHIVMKKLTCTIAVVYLCSILALAQNSQLAIFVYSDNNTPTNALRSQLTASFLNGGNSIYGVVDRTEEIFAHLTQEYQYQGSGMVRDDQLVSIGNQLAANYICVVAITYYPQYEQYFFDGKIIDISTRQIVKNTLYPNDEKTVIKSLDPQTQMRVGKELAKQLELYSPEQLAAERRKQQMEQQARERAEKEARGLRIGDVWEGDNRLWSARDGYRIGYLDGTGKHGIAFKVEGLSHGAPGELWGSKGPTCAQLMLLYRNRRMLGLNGEYWSNDLAKKEVNGFGYANWTYPWYYTVNFSTGKQEKRRTGLDDTKYTAIKIIEF